MRIERIQVGAFGRLHDFDTGPTPLGPLVVVLGPNEAGKSTLFSFLTTLLYGFQPASRERSPHVPWDTDEAGGVIHVRLADGGCATVERKLRSSPSGRLTLGDAARELRNRPVPWVEHVPRNVFRQVFAITLSELAGLDEETWSRIQDRVLGAMGATDLLPARAVAETLEREAGEIWRPNRRGNQRLRDVQDEIRSLRGRRMEALERDRSIRDLVEEAADLRLTVRDLKEERERERVVLERFHELLPARRILDRIDRLRAQGGPREALETIGEGPVEARSALEAERTRLANELAEAREEVKEPAAIVGRWNDHARSVQSERTNILALVARGARIREGEEARLTLATELREVRARIRTTADQLLSADTEGSGAAREEHEARTAERVRALSLDLLRDRVRRAEFRRAEEEARRRRRDEEPPESMSGGGPPLAVAGVLVLAGLFAIAGGIVGSTPPLIPLGTALIAVGATVWFLARPRVAPHEAEPATQESGPVGDPEQELVELLRGIDVRPEFLDPPGAPLVGALERLQALYLRHDEIGRHLSEIDERAARFRTRVGAVVHALPAQPDLDREGEASPLEHIAHLDQLLRAADGAEEAANTAGREVGRLESKIRRLADARDAIVARENDLEARVREVAGSDGGDPFAEVTRRIVAHVEADRLERDLRREHPDLEALRARIVAHLDADPSSTVDDGEVARRRARAEELQERIEGAIGRARGLEAEIAHLRDAETADQIDGQILSLQEEEGALVERRDRAWAMAQLIREADRRFREEHQPDLLRRASKYLARLTQGRYDRLLVDELGDGELFQLLGPALPRPVPLAPPISTGTLEQAYLGLRLAIVDHLDQAAERLPVFLDETLVNWDAGRRSRGLDVLADLSAERQLFAFTCHPEMAEHLEARGACLIALER